MILMRDLSLLQHPSFISTWRSNKDCHQNIYILGMKMKPLSTHRSFSAFGLGETFIRTHLIIVFPIMELEWVDCDDTREDDDLPEVEHLYVIEELSCNND